MKILLLISWAIGLVQCDKLDRTYLPPPRSVIAGGYHEDLYLPLDLPKKNYTLTLDPGKDATIVESTITSKYPNLEFGIDKQVPSTSTSIETFTNGPGIPFSKNTYNDPSTTTSYAFTQTTTVLPAETYDRPVPVSAFSQGYSPKSSSFDPHLPYDQYFIQQIIDPNTAQKTIPIIDSYVTGINISNENFGQSTIGSQFGNPDPQTETLNLPAGVNVGEYVLGQSGKISAPEYKHANIDYITSPNIIPQETSFPTSQYGGDLDSLSMDSMPTKNYSYSNKYNQPNLESYPSLEAGTNKFKSADTPPDSLKSLSSSTISLDAITVGISKPTVAIPTISSIPSHSIPVDNLNINYNKNHQPERIKAETDRNAIIINYENILTPEGFAYSFDTSNGIHADESGTAIDGVKAIGSYSFIGDDGKVYSVEYTADENGFLPRGNHLPTAPPIPDAILRGIEQAKKRQQLGIVDDGSYDNAKYGHERYQGLMGRIPQYRFNNDILSKPGTRQNALKSKTVSLEGMQLPTNQRKNLEDISDVRGFDLMTNPPKQIKFVETYNKDIVPKLSDNNYPNENKNFKSDEFDEYLNDKVVIAPKTKLRGDSTNSNSKPINKYSNENNENSDSTNSGVFSPIRQLVDSPKIYNADETVLFHRGYEYTQPQTIFNDNDGNSLQTRYSNPKEGDASNSDDRSNYGSSTTLKPFPTPNVSFNFKSQYPDSNTQILRTNFNDPFTAYGNINSSEEPNDNFGQPRASTFYNKESHKISKGEIPVQGTKRVFSTLKPAYTSTTLVPDYYYKSRDTTTVDGNTGINYPSSLGSKLFVSTTHLPSDISSRFTSSTSILNYPQTNPTTVYSTSTLKPLITSGRSEITPQRPGLRGSGSGETIDLKFQEPNDFRQRVDGRPGYQGTNVNSFVPQDHFNEDFKPRFGVSVDPMTQSIGVTSTPVNSGILSSTEKVIGEDFSGSKQLQKFDPEHGYYY